MSKELTNYTGVFVPDLTDPQPAASGQVSGAVGGNDLATSYDDHDHSAGKGLGVSLASINPDGPLNLDGQNIVEAGVIAWQADVDQGALSDRSIAFVDGALTVRQADSSVGPVALRRPTIGSFGGEALSGAWTRNGSNGSVFTLASGATYFTPLTLPSGRTTSLFVVEAASDDPASTVELYRNAVPQASASNFAVSADERSAALAVAIDGATWWLKATAGGAATTFSLHAWRVEY